MNRKQLEHVLRACGSIADSREIVVIGSQAILGAHPDAPSELLASLEADVYPLNAPEKADLIDGSIGELSPFHQTFGYYAHGVGPETALLPGQWRSRLVRIQNENTGGTTGWCVSPVDLATSKLLAGRPKDVEFVRVMLRHGLTTKTAITNVLGELPAAQANLVSTQLAQCR
jgi:hypothetical protein